MVVEYEVSDRVLRLVVAVVPGFAAVAVPVAVAVAVAAAAAVAAARSAWVATRDHELLAVAANTVAPADMSGAH